MGSAQKSNVELKMYCEMECEFEGSASCRDLRLVAESVNEFAAVLQGKLAGSKSPAIILNQILAITRKRK